MTAPPSALVPGLTSPSAGIQPLRDPPRPRVRARARAWAHHYKVPCLQSFAVLCVGWAPCANIWSFSCKSAKILFLGQLPKIDGEEQRDGDPHLQLLLQMIILPHQLNHHHLISRFNFCRHNKFGRFYFFRSRRFHLCCVLSCVPIWFEPCVPWVSTTQRELLSDVAEKYPDF